MMSQTIFVIMGTFYFMQNETLMEIVSKLTTKDNFFQFNISPLQTKHLNEYDQVINLDNDSYYLDRYIYNRFERKYFNFTASGREALELALVNLNLCSDDEVWIETTTNNFYISGCVTSTIEKYCRWSRVFSNKTKVILINHEFGFPIEDIERYLQFNLPIIEDCAFSFMSQNGKETIGKYSDYLVISFPKFLPVPYGGGLYSRTILPKVNNGVIIDLLKKLVNFYIKDFDAIKDRRLKNYLLMLRLFKENDFSARFELKDGYTPGVFMFKHCLNEKAVNNAKAYLNSQGIQSSAFYGEDSYFIPCHQEMTKSDIQYLVSKTIGVFKKKGEV